MDFGGFVEVLIKVDQACGHCQVQTKTTNSAVCEHDRAVPLELELLELSEHENSPCRPGFLRSLRCVIALMAEFDVVVRIARRRSTVCFSTADLAVMLDPLEVADPHTTFLVLNEPFPVFALDLWWLVNQISLLETVPTVIAFFAGKDVLLFADDLAAGIHEVPHSTPALEVLSSVAMASCVPCLLLTCHARAKVRQLLFPSPGQVSLQSLSETFPA